MIENARPCPFCGCQDVELSEQAFDGDPYNYQILCEGCGTTTGGYATKDEAIAFWNTRAPVFAVKTEDFDSKSTWAIMSDKEEAQEYALEALQCEPFTQKPSDEVRVYECNVNCKGLEFSQEEIFFERSQEAIKRHNQLFGIVNE